MRVGRTSIGSRIISMLLVICMVFGMVPLSAFAATDETTAASVAAIRAYAQRLLASNYAKAATATQEKTDAFSWDSEQKTDDWRYFNGVMLQALLMLGVDSDSDITNSTGNALEFAKDFMDANIKSDGTITHYIKNEVDSVPPALAIFDLLQTAELDEDTATAYEKAVNFVYKQLEAQTKYPACGGNLLHKQDSNGDPTSSWDEYELGLDGIYMAQSFYVEYANALASGKISNTVNSKTAGQIYQEVYERLMWVADAMYDETTGLYHHGYGTGDGSEGSTGGNGVFWGRGIGWYAVGLVDCIELMPDATYKANLIKKLKKLFDGMLPYQDTENAVDAIKTDSTYTGMWYNIVNTAAAVVSGEKANRPETSVSGLMAYALLKAYNEGWLTDAKYLEAGLAAFNGIVEHKLDGNSIADVYQKSGVETSQSGYCSNSYKSNEAKGVGGVLMAAAEADKYLGTAETFVGVVSAPDMTLSVGETPDYSDVKITLLGSQGTIKNVAYGDTGVAIYEYATAAIGDTAGSVTAAVYYNDVPIDTFNITVVDTTSGETVNGTATVAPDASVPGDGSKDSAEGAVTVTTTGGSTTTVEYVLDTDGTIGTTNPYVIVVKNGDNWIALKNDGDKGTNASVTVVEGAEKTVLTFDTPADSTNSEWSVNSSTQFSNVYNNTTYYIRNNSDVINTSGAASMKIYHQGNGVYALCLSGAGTYNGGRNLVYNNGWTRDDKAGGTVYLFEKVTTTTEGGAGGTTNYTITLTADQTGALVNKNGTTTLSATLSAAETEDPTATVTPTGTKVWSSADSGIATVNPETGEVTGVEAGTTTIICTVSGATVSGSEESVDLVVEIPVTVVAATTYDVSLTVTPVNMVLDIGETASFTAESAISGLTGYTANITCSTPNASVATLDGNQVTAVGEGTTSIVVTVESITNGTNTYEVTGASETIRITVNPAHEHSYTSEVTKEATCTATGTVTFTCSCGDTKTETIPAKGHTYANGECTVCGAEDPDYVPEETTKETTEAPTDEPTEETTTETTIPSTSSEIAYKLLTGAIDTSKEYVIVGYHNDTPYAFMTRTSGSSKSLGLEVTVNSTDKTVIFTDNDATGCLWTLSGSNGSYSIGNGTYYLKADGSQSTSEASFAFTTIDASAGCYQIQLKSGQELYYTGSEWDRDETNTNYYVYLYVKTEDTCEHTNTETITGKAATCTETGLTDGTKCSDCGTIITAQQTIAALGHDWNDGVITTEPGCETTGVKTYTCQNDASHTKTETVAATGHNYVDGVCSACGKEQPVVSGPTVPTVNADTVYQKLTSLTNQYTYVVLASGNYTATHGTNPGVINGSWTEVDNGWKYSTTAQLWVVEKISDSSNYYIYYVDGDNVYYLNGTGTDNYPITSATKDTQWAITFTDTTANLSIASGTVGNASNRVNLKIEKDNGPKLETSAQAMALYAPANTCDHSYTSVVTAPTCTEKGFTTHTCSKCGDSYTDNETAALGHSWNDGVVTTEPGCETTGIKTYTCQNDASHTKTETIAATGHTYGDDGICDNCGATKPTSNVTVTAAPSDGNTYKLVTNSYETGVAYVIGRYNSSYGMGAFPSASGQKMVAVYTLSDYGTDASATYTLTTAYHYYIDSEGRLYHENTEGTRYYVQFTEASSSGLQLTTDAGSASKFTISITSAGVATFQSTVGSSTRYLQVDSGGGKTNSGAKEIALYKLQSTGGDGETTEYLVKGSGQNLTVDTGKTVDPKMTLTGTDAEGNTVTVTGTWEFTSGNTAIATVQDGKIKGVSAGTATITATLKTVSVGGNAGQITDEITATFDVTVSQAVVSPDEWIHNFTEDGTTDPDNFYTISGNLSTKNGTASYDGMTLTQCLKMESSTKITFEAPNDGTLTLVFETTDSVGHSVYLTDPSGTKTSYTVPSDGVLEIELAEGGEYTLTKNSGSSYLFYMEYASALTDGVTVTAPGNMYIAAAGAPTAPTHQLVYTVRHGDADVTNAGGYSIAFESSDASTVHVSDTGLLTGLRNGSATVIVTVTMENGTIYATQVPVTVIAPTISVTESMELIYDYEAEKYGDISAVVTAGGSAVSKENYTLGYFSSDETVATVDSNGKVTAIGEGTAIIYSYVEIVNGHDINPVDAPSVDNMPNIVDATEVTVSGSEVVDAHLNSYDYIIQEGNSMDDLLLVLDYVAQITGGVAGEEGIHLTINYNTGEKLEVKATDLVYDASTGIATYTDTVNGGVLTVDLNDVNLNSSDIYTARVTYTKDGEELFLDTIWIHVVDYDPSQYDGTVTAEDGAIHYVLHTGPFEKVDANFEYVIVDKESGVALKNPSVNAATSTGALSAAVTFGNGVLQGENGNDLYNGVAQDYLTIGENDAELSAWLLDTFVQGDGYVQLNASNNLRYIGPGDAANMLIHPNVAHIRLVTMDEDTGERQIILGYGDNGDAYYLAYEGGAWMATTTESSVYLYRKDVEVVTDYGVNFDLMDKSNSIILSDTTNTGETEDMLAIPEGFSYESLLPRIKYGYAQDLVDSGDYTIVWSSSNESVARVDQNGAVTGVNSGTAVITATLYDVYGNEVICNVHNTASISKQVTVNITSANYKYVLTPNRMEIGVGSTPNFAKIAVEQRYPNAQGAYDGTSEFDQSVPFDQLVFHLADAVGYANDGSLVINSDTNRITAGSRLQTTDSTGATVDLQGFDSSVIGVYEVPVTYLDDTFYLLIYIVEDPYAGLDNADAIPGFPDAGSVRMNKTAEGVLDFTETGVTKLELTAAGVSTRSSVDVVLIVDVSNSMGWDINKSSNTGDKNKVPTNIATDEDKLDLAMEAATDFANILLDPKLDGDNTITFVTFAGNDTDHGGNDTLDSVRTPFVAQSDLDTVVGVFADTDFTAYASDDNVYTLQIGGYTETIDGVTYGEPKVSGTNRGNTNYDYAFGKTIEAVGQIKSKYAAQHDGASYDASGRQIHVVFMTDGAPSHYNNKKGTGNAADQLWKDKSTNYSTLSDVTQASWLEYIQNYNELATELYPMIDGAYTVGFDLKAGGFGDWSWTEPEMERVLQGLAKNTVVPVTMATNATELNNFYTSLARNLAYAGTNARVTDVIGGNFSLFTGVNMYSESIVASGIMSQSTYDAMASYNNGVGFPINVYSYTLVTANDIGKTMDVIDEHGNTTGNITIAEEHVGLRVNAEPELLEQVTFVYDRDTDTLEAYSNLLEGNILSESDGNRYINASTFTYSATLDTMEVDGHTITHTADETIKWKIGNITDKEVSMQYYAYLDGSLDNPREAKSGVYATNEYAYAEYVDIYNKYVKRYYGVPQVAWGAGSVRVRFYLVNSQGQFVNRAGVAFTNPANRIFLDGTARYEAELNNEVSFSALDALAQAGLAGENILYDPTAAVTVINSTTMGNGDVVWSYDAALDILDEDTKAKISDLLMDNDTSGGYHTTVVVDIPVVMTNMGQSLRPMASTTVVVDYGKPMDINVISNEEKPLITTGYVDHRNPDDGTGEYKYMMELVGFAAYSASHDLRDYVHFSNITYTDEGTGVYTGKYGNFTITDKDGANTQIRYTPTSIMGGVETVFVAVKFVEYDLDTNDATDQYYYMYKQLNILPATSVYYETDGNMDPAFNTTASGWVLATENGTSYDGIQDVYTAGSEIYGFDSSYEDNIGFSNGSAFVATGAAADGNNQFPVYATFSFTGTGFDIISRTGAEQGTIRVTYTSRDTGMSQSVSVINKGQLDLYQIPVVSIEGLAHGTYDVRIDVYPGISFGGNTILGDQFVLDAVRVYGTLVGDESIQSGDMVDGKYTVSSTAVSTIYNTDGELAPLYTEVRDLLITADKFSSDGETTGAIFMDDFTGDADVSNYNASGANNEVYLKPDQAVAFSVNVSDRFSSFDLGMKSVDGNAVTAKVTIVSGTDKFVKENLVINSSTALFYDLLAQTGFNGTGEVHVVIQNSGNSGILSLTDIKITGGVDPSFVVSSKTLAAANFAEDKGLDVTAVSAAASSVRLAQTVTLTVTTEANVTDLMITNGYGEEIWFSTGYTEADNTKVWTVAIRPTLLGEQTYTVYGFMTETVDGVETRYFGEEQTVSINVEL